MHASLNAEELARLKVFLRHVERLFASPLAMQPPEKIKRSVYVNFITGEMTHTWHGYDEERLLAQLPLLRQCILTDSGTSFTGVCGLIISRCPFQELREWGRETAREWKLVFHSKPDDWDKAFYGDRLTLDGELMDFFYGPAGLFHTAIADEGPEDRDATTPAKLHMSLSNIFRCLGNAHWIVTQWLDPDFKSSQGSTEGKGGSTPKGEEASA
jgi:hypothetical protein